jgi:hypothetical protein
MTAYICAACGRDLRLIVHRVTEDGRRFCLSCSPTDDLAFPDMITRTPMPAADFSPRKINATCDLESARTLQDHPEIFRVHKNFRLAWGSATMIGKNGHHRLRVIAWRGGPQRCRAPSLAPAMRPHLACSACRFHSSSVPPSARSMMWPQSKAHGFSTLRPLMVRNRGPS